MSIREQAEGAAAESLSWWQSHGHRARPTIQIALALVLAGGLIWRLFFASVVVPSHTLETRTITAVVMGTGTLEARTSAIIGPKIGGLILQVAADQGDRVVAGSLLFRLEDSDIEQQVGMAESEVDAAQATLDRLKASRHGAQAILAQARSNHERIVALTSRNAASKRDLDKALESLSVAEAGTSVADAGIIEGRKRLEAARRSLEYQRARLHDTTIEAPFDALILRRDRDVGDVVAPGASVFAIVSTDEMWISAWVDETELAHVHSGDLAQIVFRAQPAREFPGQVVRVGREVDRETRELLVDVRVDRLPDAWAVGQRAEVYIHVDQRVDVTALPTELILVREGRPGVLVDEAGRARWREVTLGLRGRDFVEITQGLSAGEIVLRPSDSRTDPIREGRRITTR